MIALSLPARERVIRPSRVKRRSLHVATIIAGSAL